MYFNRKNAEQKNWRMIKKGKHFLFGCSLVFAVGASLATQVVHANTAETTVANNSTTGDVNPTQNGDGKTYEAPAAVAEIKPEVATTPAVAAKLDGETAKEVKALDKTKLENYIAEIEAKLADGAYANKTEESVAVLKADLEAAKATLANATTQEEIKKAYSKLVTTANTKLKAKPVEKKVTPAVDTTNGKETVGKKAENTEKNPESNSIENTGSNDPRNRQAIPTGIQFRAEVAVSQPTEQNKPLNNHYETHILNDINGKTDPNEAKRIVGRVTDYKVIYHKDETGKITSLDWLVYFNDYLENLDNTYGTDGGELYRNYIQIPKEVNMPDTITRAQYASPRNPKFVPGQRFPQREKPNGQPLSATTSFDNPAPGSASGLSRVGYDRFNLADWPSWGKGRAIEDLGDQLPRYFKSAASDSSPTTRDILRAAAINENRLIVDRATTGGSSYNGYVWSFTTTVPNDTTNEQLQNMKVIFGMMRSATAGANGAFINVASNPVNMWQSDIYTPTAKDQTVKAGQQPTAEKSIGNFNTLPQGTTVKYKDTVDTKTPGEKQAVAVVTYPDTSKKEVPVKVIVEKEAVAPAKPVTPQPEAPKPSTPAPDAATNKPAAGAATNKPAAGNTSVASDPATATAPATVVAPTVEIPYSDPAPNKKEVYLYTGEEADVDITFNDDSGKIKSAALKQGGNKPLSAVDGNPDKQDNQFGYTVTAINSETATPAKIKVTGQVSGIEAKKLPKTEDDSLDLVTRFATATDTDGKQIENNATKYVPGTKIITESYKTDPGAVTFVLKAQTKKYDIKTPSEADKVTVSDANNVTDKEFEKIKEKVKVEYSQNNPDARLADKKGKEVEDASKVVDKVEKEGNKVVVTYKDGSKDTKPLSEFVNVAPTVEVPYSNAAKRQIYVYTGEKTDLAFTGKDETEVKDLYLRGPVNTTWDNAASYGLTTGKVENGAVTGEGTVSADKRTATIKMTGTTNLNAGQKWTSFIEAKDSDNAKSMTGVNYNVENDDDAARQQKPGYVQFIVKSQTDKYDIKTPTEKVAVTDPANVTEADLAKIKEKLQLEYKQDNDDANIAKNTAVDKNGKIKSVAKDNAGNLVVTYTDDSTDTKPLSEFVTKDTTAPAKVAEGVKDPAKTSVKDPANLTDVEKAKVAEAVKKANPTAKDVEVGKDGTATVTFPDGSKAEIPAAKAVEKAKVAEGVKDPAKTSVKDPANLTDAEKAKVAEAVKKANPTAKDVEVGKDGTATVTFPDGSKAEIPAADLTKSSEDIFKQRPYVPSNGGGNNSGNGNGTSDNNGATNTDAKVDKAKLEGAIHQLDELIIKESAKLDAETAKEANALSADAKKVFANADATQAEVDAMVKRIEDFMAKVASSTDHAIPANDQAAQKPAVAPATAQAAANAGQTASVQANARKAAKELPNTGTADSTVAMVAAAASALLGLGIAGRRRKEDEEA